MKHTHIFINRPIKQGDNLGGTKGITTSNGKSETTEIIYYHYKGKENNTTVINFPNSEDFTITLEEKENEKILTVSL
jgi:hypothetical protein